MRGCCLLLLLAMVSAGCASITAGQPISTTIPSPPPVPTGLLPPVATEEPDDPPVPEPSPTAFVPTLRQLTEPGCCVQPFWSADGRMVLFIDQPQPTAPTGIYGVSVEGGELVLISERIALPSPDGTYRAYLSDEGETVVESASGDGQWVIPNGGLRVFFSPHSVRLAWGQTERSGNFDQRPTVVSISGIDGSDPREVITVYGGGIAGWLDDDHLLLVGRDRGRAQDVALFSLSVVDGTRADLITNQRIRSVQIAPGGEWVMYLIALDPDGPAEDGLWVIRADGSQRYKLEVAGAAQWRDPTHLLIIPYEPDAPSHRLWQFDAETGQATPLTDPVVTPFRVANADWAVSPTGESVVFVNADDQALWVITLPPP